MPHQFLAICLLLTSGWRLSAQAPALNLSHDLVANRIASSNMEPNQPALDSRPLLEAAVGYAGRNGITRLIADTGDYYFLSLRNPNTHVLVNAASNLDIDWQNSNLLFKSSNVSALQCSNCSGVTLENFTLDYQQLPFTQVSVTSVNAAGQSFNFEVGPGFQAPANFNANRAADGSDAIFLFVFRDGVPIKEVGRMVAKRPVDGPVIAISDVNDPWARPAQFRAIQAGDTVVFADRSGPPAINFVNGQDAIVRNASIYSAGQIGLYFGRTNRATADHVQIIPKPGTARLISTNADGIHTSFAVGANVFTNNIVRRTCDDALAISAPWLASVTRVNGTTVVVSRNVSSPFPPGAAVSFINPATAAIAGMATIVSESPAYDQQRFTDGEVVMLTLDQAIPGNAAGFGIIDADPAKRGSGSLIAYNTVQDGVFARGVWLAGVQDVSVHDNYVQRTSSNGIFIQQLGADRTDAGPSSNITIQNNLVDGAINYGNVAHGLTFAAASIYAVSQNDQNAQVASSPHSNIVVTGNRITNSARSAIRLENVTSGKIDGNIIQGYAAAPVLNTFTAPPCCETLGQYQADFSQAVLTRSSSSVVVTGNTEGSGSSLIQTVSAASGYPRLAFGSVAVAHGANLAADGGDVSVSITDSSGATLAASIMSVSSSQVNYLVPDEAARGIATVTIGSSSGSLQIDTVAPGLYSKNDDTKGVALADAALHSADGSIMPVVVSQCDPGEACVSVPMDLGSPTDQLVVTLYGTGFRNLTSKSAALATVGGVAAPILSIGERPDSAELDQVTLVVPRALAGAGEVPVILTVDGQTANVVTLNIQ